MSRPTTLFDAGVAALEAALPMLPHVAGVPAGADAYACPLCLQGFDRGRITSLTKEHVPPSALGGSVVCLTCDTCNNAASTYQAHARARADEQVFSQKADGASHPVRVRHPLGVVTADVVWNGGKFYVIVDPTRSAPSDHQGLVESLDAARSGGRKDILQMEVTRRFEKHKARRSLLRDAYLAAFATFGYAYILWPDLDPVRDEIADERRSDKDLDLYWKTDSFGPSARLVIALAEPLQAVLVVLGDDVVFLPWPTQGAQLQPWLDHWDGDGSAFQGQVLPWPTSMLMLLDQTHDGRVPESSDAE